MLWVSEYGKIFLGARNLSLPGGNLQLCEGEFRSLLAFLDDKSDAAQQFGAFFKYARPNGRDQLSVQNYAGVIATDSGLQIEILPKLSRVDDPSHSRSLLVKMLMSLTDSPFKSGTSALLNAHKMPLFELLMRQFLEHVTDIARKGIARSYHSQQANLLYLRGKFKLSEHIKRNHARQDKVFCEYDEYEENRPINRLIRAALDLVKKLTVDATNQKLCRELLFWFNSVPPSASVQNDFQQIQRDRMIRHYAPAMPSCEMILKGLNPLTQQRTRRALSMLFPMERVFESFVSSKLRAQFPSWRISSQVTGTSLVEDHRGRRIFALRPDLMLRKGGLRVVADTKWKLINATDKKKNYEIKQSDVYQLFAYSRKFLNSQIRRETYLIYPRTQQFDRPLPPFWYQEHDEVLFVLPYDIEEEVLCLPEGSSLFDDYVPVEVVK